MKPSTIDEYILQAPAEAQGKLIQMLEAVRLAAPGATEGLKWSMPAFSYKRILVTFAAFKNHIGFYPTPSAIEAFSDKLKAHKTAKGSIQFPLNQALPVELVQAITAFRVRESLEGDKKWKP